MRKVDLEKAWQKRMVRIGMFISSIDEGRGCKAVDSGLISEIRIKMPSEDRGEVLVIVKVSGPGGKRVGFIGGPDLATALLMWMKREGVRGVIYREDLPWAPPEKE